MYHLRWFFFNFIFGVIFWVVFREKFTAIAALRIDVALSLPSSRPANAPIALQRVTEICYTLRGNEQAIRIQCGRQAYRPMRHYDFTVDMRCDNNVTVVDQDKGNMAALGINVTTT
jgi:hypothetical protein